MLVRKAKNKQVCLGNCERYKKEGDRSLSILFLNVPPASCNNLQGRYTFSRRTRWPRDGPMQRGKSLGVNAPELTAITNWKGFDKTDVRGPLCCWGSGSQGLLTNHNKIAESLFYACSDFWRVIFCESVLRKRKKPSVTFSPPGFLTPSMQCTWLQGNKLASPFTCIGHASSINMWICPLHTQR